MNAYSGAVHPLVHPHPISGKKVPGFSEFVLKMLTGWWFQIFVYFHPYLGKIPILTNIFQRG